MKKIKPIILIGLLYFFSAAELGAQSTVPFVNQLTTATSGTQVVKARSMIVFGPGFSYTPSSGTLTTQIENPLTTGTVSYAFSQPEPSTTAISTSYKPGTLPGMVDISQVGSAGYSIPIELPKGVDGFQPSLAISYSSMAGDGIMGNGWRLDGLGVISRVPSSLYYDGTVDEVDFELDDRFTLNGQHLIWYGGATYGQSGSEYRLEQDQSVKITYSSGSFLVKSADGITYEYGNSPDSKVGDTSNALSWHLCKITNNYGQVINIRYDQSSGWAYPALITYGASTIELYYKNRASDNVSYLNGNTYRLSNILDSIQVWNNGAAIKQYRFIYYKTNETPLLSEIIYYGIGGKRLNSSLFKYSLNTPFDSSKNLISKTNSCINYKYRLVNGDFNGDGQSDFLCIPNPNKGQNDGIWRVQFSDGDKSFSIPDAGYLVRSPNIDYDNLKGVVAADLNNDGLDDVVFAEIIKTTFSVTTNFYYMKNNKSSFYSPVRFHQISKTGILAGLFYNLGSHRIIPDKLSGVSDYNGDGINDILICEDDGAWKIFSLSADNSFSSISIKASGNFASTPNKVVTGDFNGDGKTDIWTLNDNGVKVFSLENGLLAQKCNYAGLTSSNSFICDDFNGDGLKDVFVYGINNGNQSKFLFSTGTSFVEHNNNQVVLSDIAGTSDFNGDGRADIVCVNSNSEVNVYFFNRDGSLLYAPYFLSFNLGGGDLSISDYDGDGRSDFITTSSASPFNTGYEYYSTYGNNQDLLSEVRNGLGLYTKISYISILDHNASKIYDKGLATSSYPHPLLHLLAPLNVVSKVQTSTGIGGYYNSSYKYARATIHKGGKGFLGFLMVTATNEATGISTENNYYINPNYYYPELTRTVVRHNTGNIRTVLNGCAQKSFSGSKRFIPYISSSTTTDNLTGFSTTTTTSEPDDYGNILSQSVAYANGPTQSKSIIYNNDAANWLVARPCSLTTTMSLTGTNIEQLVTTTYEAGKVKPDIVKYFDGTTQKRQLNHDYNGNGTLSAFHEASTGLTEKHTSYSYDVNGINMVKTVSPEGIRDSAVYYPASGLINKTIDHWGNVASYNYDSIGNVASIIKPNGIGISSNVLAFVSSPTYACYSATQTMSDGSQSVAYFDVLGREIRRGTKLFDGTISCTQTDYNAKGQAYRVSEPFLSTGTPSLWNTTIFDRYGRDSIYTPSVGASSAYTYSSDTTIVTSNGRTYTTITANAAGWVASKTDAGGTISYSYKPDGNVKQITAPGSVNTYMTYDTYGNQLTLNDPSAGNTTYTYYGGGELSTQLTPKGTTTNYYLPDGRLDYYTNPAGTYDYTYGPNKLVSGITSPGSVLRSYTYYSNGKVDEISETIETGQTNKVKFVYDSYGRVSTKTYNNENTESYVYSNGYLDQVKFNGTVVYDATTMNTRGNIIRASICGTQTDWAYDQYGQLTGNSAYYTQSYYYTPNPTSGNLTSRNNSLKSLTETFYYDNLDRLDSVRQGSTRTLLMGYDTKGNITTKSDAGTYLYDNGKPYQVAHVTPYIAINFPSVNQDATYTSFGKVSTLSEGNYSATFKYNADNERVKMVISQSGSAIKTKYYFGSSYEKVIEGGDTTEFIWIGGSPYTAVAVAKIVNRATPVVYAIFRDNLGTITHIKTGSNAADEYSFDAFGRRRSATNWSYTLNANDKALFADRGFTGHEHLTQFGLINMNGRLYDPLVGRFLNPDNYVQSPGSTQGYNRYSYCLNNPLRYTDPSGDNPALIGVGIYAAFVYLKGAHDNRDMATGKWAWNPVSWFGKGKTGVVVGVNTNTDFTSVNYYAGLYNPDFSPVLSYNPNYGLGMGNVTNPGSTFYYPSYNPPSAESVANKFISNAKNVSLASNLVGGIEYNYNMAVDANPKSSASAKGIGMGLSVLSTSLTGYQVYNQIKQGKVCPADATNFVAGSVGVTSKFVSWLGYGGKAVSFAGGVAGGVGTALTIFQLWDNVYSPMNNLRYAPSYIDENGEPFYDNYIPADGW